MLKANEFKSGVSWRRAVAMASGTWFKYGTMDGCVADVITSVVLIDSMPTYGHDGCICRCIIVGVKALTYGFRLGTVEETRLWGEAAGRAVCHCALPDSRGVRHGVGQVFGRGLFPHTL